MKLSPLRTARVLLPQDLPKGYRFAAVGCGLRKKNRLDLALVSTEKPAAAAAVFTNNLVKAAPVLLCQEHLRRAAGEMRALIVNSGNANCANGPAGLAASRATANGVARELGCRPPQVLVCSTGVIGVPLAVQRILAAVPRLAHHRADVPAAFSAVTRAIMTTDTRPKWASAACRIGSKTVRLLGCAKGAGMIHPQMATTLAFVFTDAAASPRVLRRALGQVVDRTFNVITVDGDTSTNDTLLLLANGASGAPRLAAAGKDYARFVAALERVCGALALEVVSDGEGAQRVIEIEVRGASSDRAADRVARTIAHSPLVKTALAGADPNWGRILAAAGRAGVVFDPGRVEVRMAGIVVCRRGCAYPFSERAAHQRLLERYVPIVVGLKQGPGRARVWTCDFTTDYVHINANYRT
jgi:glutamate N-acetyltransferase/amino-acid N-acetyltransferase